MCVCVYSAFLCQSLVTLGSMTGSWCKSLFSRITYFFNFANSMLQRSGYLKLGDLLSFGAKVLFPRLVRQGTLLATLLFASSFSWLDLGNDLHCGGHRVRQPLWGWRHLIPVLRQVRAWCTGCAGEDNHSTTPRWCCLVGDCESRISIFRSCL